MTTRRALLAAALTLLPVVAIAETGKFADPQPSIDHPRRIVLSISEDDPKRIAAVLSNITNIQKYYDATQVKMAVIAYGPGLVAVLKGSPVAQRIASLQDLEVDFIACGATLETMKKTAADLLPQVTVVPNGLPEIVERSLRGWIHLHP
jgi:intracellular sulfur oxidation DsrE/DsrF family protein